MRRLSRALRLQWPSLILGGVLIVAVATFIMGSAGPGALADLVAHRTRLSAENGRLRDENTQLELQITRLRSDDRYLQRMIRKELGYARSDEFVYHFRSGESAQR